MEIGDEGFSESPGSLPYDFFMPFLDESLLTMMIRRLLPFALIGLSFLSGCTTLQDQQARGNMIIIARYDSRYPENGQRAGRAVTDNAGGVPGAMAGAAGMPTSAAGGAGLDLGVGLLVNLVASEAMKNQIPMAFKVLYEKDCEYAIRYLDLRTSPDAQKLYPGYMARLEGDKDGGTLLQPLTDESGQQVYLTKSHPCYATWVAEWKNHEDVKRSNWSSRRNIHLFGPTPVIPEPNMAWVK